MIIARILLLEVDVGVVIFMFSDHFICGFPRELYIEITFTRRGYFFFNDNKHLLVELAAVPKWHAILPARPWKYAHRWWRPHTAQTSLSQLSRDVSKGVVSASIIHQARGVIRFTTNLSK